MPDVRPGGSIFIYPSRPFRHQAQHRASRLVPGVRTETWKMEKKRAAGGHLDSNDRFVSHETDSVSTFASVGNGDSETAG